MKVQDNKKHYILWADDDLDDLQLMRETFELIGSDHPVVEVYNGQEVLDHLNAISSPEEYPCLIILDNNMPLMSGRNTLSQIRQDKKFNDIPVAVFSTTISKADNSFYNNLGALCYIKPDTMKDYKRVFSELLTHCTSVVKEAA